MKLRMGDQAECILVSYDPSSGEDYTVMLVGRQVNNRIHILNAFQGDKAAELWKSLTTQRRAGDIVDA